MRFKVSPRAKSAFVSTDFYNRKWTSNVIYECSYQTAALRLDLTASVQASPVAPSDFLLNQKQENIVNFFRFESSKKYLLSDSNTHT